MSFTQDIKADLAARYRERQTELLDQATAIANRSEMLEGDDLARFERLETEIAEAVRRAEYLERDDTSIAVDSSEYLPGAAPNQTRLGKTPHEAVRNSPGMLNSTNESATLTRAALESIDGIDAERVDTIAELADGDLAEARLQLAKSDPAYKRAFAKLVVNPGLTSVLDAEEGAAYLNAQRAALSVAGSGSTLVPTAIDPAFILTNTGAGPMSLRSLGRPVTIGVSTWQGISTAGVTASMDAELDEVSDDTPTVASVSAALKSGRAFVEWSYEVEQDQAALLGELRLAMSDAKTNLEDAQLAAGLGTGSETQGLFVALDGTASETAPATAEVFALDDIFTTQAALPTRFAASAKVAWVMHSGTALKLRQLVYAQNSGNSVWSDIGAGKPSLLNGVQVAYNDQAPSAYSIDAAATADNRGIATIGDFSRFVIADHSAGTLVELIPNVIGANRRPIGARGLYMSWRYAAKTVDTNAFRMLSIPTTA
jgi:HK97 family phage major capsid protein